jgi:hypothetical protein
MNPVMIAFFFGAVVGGLGGILLMGLLFLAREPNEEAKEEATYILQIPNNLYCPRDN